MKWPQYRKSNAFIESGQEPPFYPEFVGHTAWWNLAPPAGALSAMGTFRDCRQQLCLQLQLKGSSHWLTVM